MALTYDQISGITKRKFVPKLVDNFFDSNPAFQRMKAKNLLKLDGGTQIDMPLEYAALSAAGFYDGADTLSTADNETITSASYNWKHYYVNITIKRTDELKNMGDSQVISLVKAKTKGAEKTLADDLGTAFWNTGSAAKNWHGVRHLISTTNTIGGISATNNSWWQGNVSTASVVSLANLQTEYNVASIGNDTPTVGFTTRTIYDLYYNLLVPQQRFMDKDTAKAGFSSLMFNGRPIIVDSHCPSSHLAFINEDYLKMVVHKEENMRFEPFAKPVNQNIKTAKIYISGNFVSSNNRMHALFTSLAS